MITRRPLLLSALLPALATAPRRAAAAHPAGIVAKQVFEGGAYRTRGGGAVSNMRVGYQTAGTLNAAGDNAVLICHFFSGTSHAFGRYEADGPVGWWDAIIGPGRPIDTDRYFVVASDTPVNLTARDARTHTTGPATVDPSTGRPFAMNFPVVSIRDFVEVQKRLLDHLGVKRLALVAGPSMGGLQAIEWAAAYPEMVERVMPAVATGVMDAYLQAWLGIWAEPIRLDPNWRNGDYYAQGREAPLRGLADALRIVSVHAGDRGAFAHLNRAAVEGQEPARRVGDQLAVDRFLDESTAVRARGADANSFLYLVRANQLFLNEYPDTEAALSRSRARWLVVPAVRDRIFPVEYGRELAATLRRLGRPTGLAELSGSRGHLEGVVGMGAVADQVSALLAAPGGAG